MLSEFDRLVNQRRELVAWWGLRTTVAAYEGTCHSLRVDVQKPSFIAYCGQQYAGAKNYHEAPGFFAESVRKEMQAEAERLAVQAYEKELARLNEAIEKHRAAVLKELASA